MPFEKLEYNKEIAKKVKKFTRNGVPIKTMIASIQGMQFAPRSYDAFYKYYGPDMEAAKAGIISQIGDKVVKQAIKGDPKDSATFKSQELYLRTQGGWTPKESLETREVGADEEEESNAVEALMKALGKSTTEESDVS